MAKNKTLSASDLATRIAQLETADLPNASQDVADAEADYTDTLASGGDSTTALNSLIRSKEKFFELENGLQKLDELQYQLSIAEYQAAMQAINSSRDKRYETASTEIRSKLGGVKAVLDGLIPTRSTSLVNELIENCLTQTWQTLDEMRSVETRQLGLMPVKRVRKNRKETDAARQAELDRSRGGFARTVGIA